MSISITSSMIRVTALAAALVLSFGTQAASSDPSAKGNKAAESVQAVGPLKLSKTYIDSGNASGAALAAGAFTPVGGPVTVTCGLSAGCNLSATMEVQIAQINGSSPAICFYVDGSSVNCPFADRLTATSGFKVVSHTTSTLLSLGTHTLEQRVFTDLANTYYRYHSEYRLFK